MGHLDTRLNLVLRPTPKHYCIANYYLLAVENNNKARDLQVFTVNNLSLTTSVDITKWRANWPCSLPSHKFLMALQDTQCKALKNWRTRRNEARLVTYHGRGSVLCPNILHVCSNLNMYMYL